MKKDKAGFKFANVLTISGIHLLHDIYGSFLAPLMPLLKERLGFDDKITGLLYFMQRIPSLFSPLVGVIADRKGLKYLVIITPAVTAIAMSLLGAASSVWMLIMLLLVAGFSSAAFHVPTPVMIRNSSGSRTGRGMSMYMIGGESARFLGPLAIVAAVSYWGLEGSWRLMFFGIASSFVLYFIFRRMKGLETRKKDSLINERALPLIRKHLSIFLLLGGFLFFHGLMKSLMSSYLTIYLTNKEFSFESAAINLAILQGAGVFGTFLSGYLSDFIGRKRTLLIISVLTPLFFYSYLQLTGFYAVAALAILGLIMISTGPVLLSLIQDIQTDRPALLNSVYMTINFVISSGVVLLNGFMADLFTLGKLFTYAPFAGIGTVTCILLLKLKK